MAQVYSLNVVGYVNVSLQQDKLHFLSLPLAQFQRGLHHWPNDQAGRCRQDFANFTSGLAQRGHNSYPATWFGGAWDNPEHGHQ